MVDGDGIHCAVACLACPPKDTKAYPPHRRKARLRQTCAVCGSPARSDALAARAAGVYSGAMTLTTINIGDRARLRERFFGATHAVRACL